MTARALCYDDDPEYEVEIYDHVNVRLGGDVFRGQVTATHLRRREVTVAYEDHFNPHRTTFNPRRKRCRVPVDQIDLIRRDG